MFFYELSGSGFESSCSHLFDNLSFYPKLIAADTSLCSVVYDINQSRIYLNDDLKEISNWSF